MHNTGYRILAEGKQISNDTWITGLNNNDCIIGPSGAGKTRSYVLPNILQCNGSMVITDTKGALREQVGAILQRNGYKVMELNLTNCRVSTIGYNPLRFIRYDQEREYYNEQDILRVSACLVPIEILKDPFWDRAARMLLETLVGYLLECQQPEEHTLDNVTLLLSELGGKAGALLDEYAMISPESFAAVRWKLFKNMTAADRTTACVQGILAEKLSVMMFDGLSGLFNRPDQIDFATIGRERSALFLNISDTDRSLDPLAALFYAQALQELCREADRTPDHRLNTPVHFYLDDFAANAVIPDFDKVVSTIRSREISVSIILQSISQLESLYTHAQAMTVLNNCDHMLYLGGQDVETARYISAKANKPASAILNMPLDSVWLFTRGHEPQQVHKYNLTGHPRYFQPSEQPFYSRDYYEDEPF
ncbi:MAG: type IV secretory system conjugative DNA transfer family protein [Oscillibacter sp.]|nr:type IV secretory system conjugative DNA transfer family protein [Oscillibacter sp.]